MESLYFLVPCALIFIAIAVKVLFWAINNGQYDNLDAEGHRILFEEKNKAVTPSSQSPDSPPASHSEPELPSHKVQSPETNRDR